MDEFLHTLLGLMIVFGVVVVLNVIPVFAPPTWVAISYIAVRYQFNILMLALVGATAATLGRMVLARLSHIIVRQKFLNEGTKQNIDYIKQKLEKNQKLTFGIFLLYAFSPFPSNHLFIAYGLTGLGLKLIAIPFFVGRVATYAFFAFGVSGLARKFAYEKIETGSFFSFYFIVSQLFTVFLIYLFMKIDWRALFTEKRLKWRKRNLQA